MKSTVTPSEILDTIAGLPQVESAHTGLEPQDRLKALLTERPETAFVTRILIYSVGAPSIAQKLLDGGLPVHETAQALDADMQMIEMDTDTTQADDNARGTAFGLMAAEPNTGLIVTTALGPQDVPEGDFWQKATPNIAAVLGTMISGATARIPVIAEGKGAIAAADMLAKLRPDMMQYVFACESSPEESDGPGYSGSMLAAWGLSQALEEDAA